MDLCPGRHYPYCFPTESTKGVRYYLTCKVALVSATLQATLLGVPVPFAPIQIILMELLMDLAAAPTFVAEPSEGDLMRPLPRDPRAGFMDRAMLTSIFVSALGLLAAVSISYLGAWNSGADPTTAFVTSLLGHIFLALNMRSERLPLVKLCLFSNCLNGRDNMMLRPVCALACQHLGCFGCLPVGESADDRMANCFRFPFACA